jgi:hypothetical protein
MPQGKQIDNAVQNRLNDDGVCTLEECSSRYDPSPDRKSCILNVNKVNTVKQYDCESEFNSDETGSCSAGSEGGVVWNFSKDSTTYCYSQLKNIEVIVSSDAYPEVKFKTTLPGSAKSVGISGLPVGFGGTNLEFLVNPIMKDGQPLLATPKVIQVSLKANKGACSGINMYDAFGSWNENNNLTRTHWAHNGGNVGSFQIYNKNGGRVYDSGHKIDLDSGVVTTTNDMTGGTWCQGGSPWIYRDNTFFALPQYDTKQSRTKFNCWAGRAEYSFERA